MTLRSRSELLPRDAARAQLLRDGWLRGQENARLGLVALGGGGGPGLDEARLLLASAIRLTQQNPDAPMSQVRWIELAGPLETSSIDAPAPQVLEGGDGELPWLVLRDVHPMGAVLRAFDGAVAAAGYNTVHEAQVAALPTILWPFARDVDDQFARARLLASQHRALVFEAPATPSAPKLASLLCDLFDGGTGSRLRASMLAAQASRGAENGTEIGARAMLDMVRAL